VPSCNRTACQSVVATETTIRCRSAPSKLLLARPSLRTAGKGASPAHDARIRR